MNHAVYDQHSHHHHHHDLRCAASAGPSPPPDMRAATCSDGSSCSDSSAASSRSSVSSAAEQRIDPSMMTLRSVATSRLDMMNGNGTSISHHGNDEEDSQTRNGHHAPLHHHHHHLASSNGGKFASEAPQPLRGSAASPSGPTAPAPPVMSLLPTSLPQLLQRRGGLSAVPQSVLEQCLEPVRGALRDMDAVALLHLETTSCSTPASPADDGPLVQPGIVARPIHEQVHPPVDPASLQTPMPPHASQQQQHPPTPPSPIGPVVRYIHLAEVPNQYSMGIFVFPPHAKIPLHDHPGMCVLSRVLYGDLTRVSLDLLAMHDVVATKAGASIPPHYPAGTRRAMRRHTDHLRAPDVTTLYPLEGNLHEFIAGPHGAAVLDVLLPPYSGSRDCTFYFAQPAPPAVGSSRSGDDASMLYYLIPTGQPEDFHCISGQYRDIGSP